MEEAPVDAVPDGYAVREQQVGTSTLVFDPDTGTEVTRLDGTQSSWCS